MLKIKTLLPLCKFFVTQHFDYDKKVTIFQEAKTCDNVREHLDSYSWQTHKSCMSKGNT